MNSRLILKNMSEAENASFTGKLGEVISLPNKGLALHNGSKKGGLIIEPLKKTSVSGRNLIRNSSFIVNQKNITNWLDIPTVGKIENIIDGWFFHKGGGSKANVATSRTFTDGENDSYSALRVTTFSGGTKDSFSVLSQQIADVRLLAGRTITISYKARATTNRRIAVSIRQDFNSTVDVLETFCGNSELTAEWQNFEHTVQIPAIDSDMGIGVGHFTGIWFWLDAGSNYDNRTGGIGNTNGQFDITNIKLEISSHATSYSELSYEDELERVKRYFEVSNSTVFMGQFGINNPDTVQVSAFVPFDVPKYKNPTISELNTSFVKGATVSSQSIKGFNVLGSAENASSVARVLGYVADAEILPY